MSGFINKSTKKVAPKLSGFRRRPVPSPTVPPTPDASDRPSTEPQPSPTPSQSQLTPISTAQQQDAPGPLPEPQQLESEPPSASHPPLQTPENSQDPVQDAPNSGSSALSQPSTESERDDGPPSKRRRLTPPPTQNTEAFIDEETRDTTEVQQQQHLESLIQSTQPISQSEAASTPASEERPTTDSIEEVQVTDHAATTGSQIAEDQRETTAPQALEQHGSAHARGQVQNAEKPVQSRSKPPLPPASPPFGGTIMRTVEDSEEPLPIPKQRKVRKDKGTRRQKKRQEVGSGVNDSQHTTENGYSETHPAGRGDVNASEGPSEASRPPATESRTPTRGVKAPKSRSHTFQPSLTPAITTESGPLFGGTSRPRKRKRQRPKTPPENEHVEITPSITTMHDLCRDTRTGKTSSKEKRLQARDMAEIERRQQVAQERLRSLNSVVQSARDLRDDRDRSAPATNGDVNGEEPVHHQGPTLRLVDGVIQLDETSLQVDRHAAAAGSDPDAAGAPIEEDDLAQRITGHSWMYVNRRDPVERQPHAHKADPWDPEQTRLFYEALRMFGTDFEIISAMFPGRTRRRIKAKFTREERENPELIDEALGVRGRVPMNLEQYAQATGRDPIDGDEDGEEGGERRGFVDPAKLKEELAKEEEQAMKEIEEVRKEAEEERRQREAAELHQSGEGMGGEGTVAGSGKESEGGKRKRKCGNEKEDGKSTRKRKKRPPVAAGGEEVIQSVE